MAIIKPTWLKTWLDRLHWDIFTWHIEVGAAIEDAIDWVIDWLNWLVETVYSLGDQIRDYWDSLYDFVVELSEKVNREINRLLNEIDAWWDDLAEWWQVKRAEVSSWIGIATRPLYDWVNELQISINEFNIRWDNFWTTTYPQLIDTTKLDLSLRGLRQELEPFWEGWQDLKGKVAEFFADPEEWLYKAVDRIIERFW